MKSLTIKTGTVILVKDGVIHSVVVNPAQDYPKASFTQGTVAYADFPLTFIEIGGWPREESTGYKSGQ